MTDTENQGEPLLSIRNLKTHFSVGGGFLRESGKVKAVDGVSFDIPEGSIFGLVGESGSGKSTLGRSILQLIRPTSGEVLYQGHDLTQLNDKQMRPLRRELGLIQQDPNAALNPAMTVVQGIGHPLWIHGMVDSKEEARAKVVEMLEKVGLHPAAKFLDRYPDEFSGGQKQRLVIARTLITRPQFVVADEPVAALDMSVRARVLELMMELGREFGVTYLFITHDLATARFLCNRIGILYLGGFVELGESKALFDDPLHPYTGSLLEAIPLPEAGRRNREKILPRGEIPDASHPPAGCRFHPRCPKAFDVCGWEGRDLVDAIEERWIGMEPEKFEREERLVGKLDKADVKRETVRFHSRHPEELATWLREQGPELPSAVYEGVTDVSREGQHVVVRFGSGPEPAVQTIRGRDVACHLHGVVPREGGEHVGDPTEAVARPRFT